MKIIINFGSFGLNSDQDSNPDLDQTLTAGQAHSETDTKQKFWSRIRNKSFMSATQRGML